MKNPLTARGTGLGEAIATTKLLEQLLEQQQRTNALLWGLMTPEQRERYRRGE